MGRVRVGADGDGLSMAFATGATLRLAPWTEDVFTATLASAGRFATLAEALGPDPIAFAQFQIDPTGHPTLLSLKLEDGQAYVFSREEVAGAEGACARCVRCGGSWPITDCPLSDCGKEKLHA